MTEGRRAHRFWCGVLAVAVLLVVACGGDDGGAGESAVSTPQGECLSVDDGWVAAWGASPTAAAGDPSAEKSGETLRAVLTPTFGGAEARVRLSNRHGDTAVTFGHVTIARRAAGASVVADTITDVTFDGEPSVSVEPGGELVSDPVAFTVEPFETVAVSLIGPDDVRNQTQHPIARQTSYLTPPHAGDQTADADGRAYTEMITTRPFVTGLDVRSPEPAGTVVAFGDSITDGYQGEPPFGFPESAEGMDEDGRYPDVLARRLAEADRPLAVVNTGISGNRVLRDGIDGPQGETAGPAALDRAAEDVLAVPGATAVILLAGINDLGMPPNDDPADIIDGYERLIGRFQADGLHVLHGTLTPAGGSTAYGTPEVDIGRAEINEWIRTESPADAVIDFDAVVRDPAEASRLAREFDGGDHLHVNLTGNRALADAVPLEQLETCGAPR